MIAKLQTDPLELAAATSRLAAGLFKPGLRILIAAGLFFTGSDLLKTCSKELGTSVLIFSSEPGKVATAKPLSPGSMLLFWMFPEGKSLTMQRLALSKYCLYSGSSWLLPMVSADSPTDSMSWAGATSSNSPKSSLALAAICAAFSTGVLDTGRQMLGEEDGGDTWSGKFPSSRTSLWTAGHNFLPEVLCFFFSRTWLRPACNLCAKVLHSPAVSLGNALAIAFSKKHWVFLPCFFSSCSKRPSKLVTKTSGSATRYWVETGPPVHSLRRADTAWVSLLWAIPGKNWAW